MSFVSYKHGFSPKIELKSKECIDLVLQPLKYHVTIKVNGSLTSEDIFRTVVSMAVDNNSVHSVSKQYQDVACETSLRYHLKKLRNDETIISSISVTDIFFDVYLGKWNYRAIPKVKTWSYFLTIPKYLSFRLLEELPLFENFRIHCQDMHI